MVGRQLPNLHWLPWSTSRIDLQESWQEEQHATLTWVSLVYFPCLDSEETNILFVLSTFVAGRTEIAVPDFVVAYRDIVGAHGLKDLRLYCESISQNTTVDARLKETEFPFASRTVPETDARSMNTSSDLSSSTSYLNETFSAGKDLPSHFDSDILWPSIGTSSKEINLPKKPDDGIKPSLTTESSLVIRADEEDDSELQVENNLPKQLPP